MRYILLSLLLPVLLLSQLHSVELQWQKDLATAFEKASKEHKPLMVLVETDNCRWCKKMKYNILQDVGISKRLQEFVIVKVHRDRVKSEHIPYAKFVPTIYFMDHNKKILERVVGYFSLSDFHSWIDDAQAKLK